jgi:hypothetical protein
MTLQMSRDRAPQEKQPTPVSHITPDARRTVLKSIGRRFDVMMIVERDNRFWRAGAPVERLAMIAKRDYRSSWRTSAPAEWQDRDNPYELFAVGLWSVVGVALTTMLTWLALGGEL